MVKRVYPIILLALLGGAGFFAYKYAKPHSSAPLGTAEDGSQWIKQDAFQGYYTKLDAQKLPDGANPSGQNTSVNEGDRISIRPLGLDVFPSSEALSTTTTRVQSLHNFRRRSGENVLLRASSSTLEWYEKGETAWETLKSGYQSADFGFADNNINTDQVSYVYFGNGLDSFSRWNGAHTLLTSALTGGEVSIPVVSTGGFDPTGDVFYCGATTTYTGKTATAFTVVSAHACGNGRGIAQAVAEYAGATYPRGNIYLLADNRLFISGVASSSQAVYFSKYGDPLTFAANLVDASTAANAGLFNLAEGGGAVTAMVLDEGSLYFFKKSIVYKATLTDALYTLQPLKSFDQKSQTTGALNKRSTFTSSNGVFYVTPDNQIMYLTRVVQVDYPQIVPISDPIKPTVSALDFTNAAGIVYRDKAYFAMRQSTDSSINDTVLVFNTRTQQWDSPIVGWNVADFVVYQDATSEQMYVGDDVTQNVYVVNSTPEDAGYGITANWRSKRYDFGMPYAQKYLGNVFVDGYIGPNTNLNISLLLDEDGFTQTFTTTLHATDTQYIYNSTLFNPLGLSPFGVKRFGSNEDLSGVKPFRVYLGKDFRQIPFYNAQLEFASDGDSQQWEVKDYGFLVRPVPVSEKRELFKAFK